MLLHICPDDASVWVYCNTSQKETKHHYGGLGTYGLHTAMAYDSDMTTTKKEKGCGLRDADNSLKQ